MTHVFKMKKKKKSVNIFNCVACAGIYDLLYRTSDGEGGGSKDSSLNRHFLRILFDLYTRPWCLCGVITQRVSKFSIFSMALWLYRFGCQSGNV